MLCTLNIVQKFRPGTEDTVQWEDVLVMYRSLDSQSPERAKNHNLGVNI
jgi:hypothetical protein